MTLDEWARRYRVKMTPEARAALVTLLRPAPPAPEPPGVAEWFVPVPTVPATWARGCHTCRHRLKRTHEAPCRSCVAYGAWQP